MPQLASPSRPAGLIGALIALVILLLALTSGAGFSPVLAVVCLVLVGMIAFNLWVAYAPVDGRGRRSSASAGARAAAGRRRLSL
jgi:predicted lipid-binding transport protein (Tim44 family)